MINKNKMKIAIVVDEFPRYSEKFIFDRVAGLIKNGFDVTIFTHRKGDFTFFKSDIHKYDIDKKIIIYPSKNILGLLLSPLKTSKLIKDLLKSSSVEETIAKIVYTLPFLEKSYDIIHFEFGLIGEKMIFLKDYLPDTKFVTSFRGSDLHYRKRYDYTKLFQKCDYFHFISSYLLNEAINRGLNKNKATVINPSIDTYLFKPLNNKHENKKLTIIGSGRLHWMKGYSYALSAIKILKEKGFKFVYKILGNGDCEEIIKHQILEEHLGDCVELLGAVPREKVKEELEKADIFLHTAICEGFSNAVLEAQAIGLPIVCSDVGGLKENIENGKTGLLVPARQPEEIAKALIYLIKHPKTMKKFGGQGRKRVVEKFNLEKQSEEFKRMYEKILEK
jgi:colanic acid/amylovoran biosynthesis glycosyltransferase